MAELIIDSIPIGAMVSIDGEDFGTTPLVVPIDTGGIDEFREACMSDGEVICDWNTLRVWLERKQVGEMWWDLTFEERYSIAHVATSNTMNFFMRYFRREAGCGFGGYEHAGECSSNTTIRCSKFDHPVGCIPESGLCFWKKNSSDVWHNFKDEKNYNIPCFFASTGSHVMCAIALNKTVEKLADILIFQYSEIDIQPGSTQLPSIASLIVVTPNETTCTGYLSGTTVATIKIPESSATTYLLREECLTDESVTCDWATLEEWLISAKVGEIWWDLTEAERRSIAEHAIKNTVFYYLSRGRSGKADCLGGEGDYKKIVCVQNAVIRCLKFGDYVVDGYSPIGGDRCYYADPIDGLDYCYVPDECYHLPCHTVSCIAYDGAGFGHAMSAIQVVNDIDKMSNWVIFQYSTHDIQRGDRQIPNDIYDLRIDFGILTHVADRCGGYSDEDLVRFDHI